MNRNRKWDEVPERSSKTRDLRSGVGPVSATAPQSEPELSTRLRSRILRAVTFIIVGAVFFAAYAVTFFVYRTERESWATRQAEAVNNAALTVETFVDQIQDYMTVVGQLDQEYIEAHPEFLHSLLENNAALLEIIRVDREGGVFASAHQDSPVIANLFTIPQSNWFVQARQGNAYISNLQISAQSEPYVIVAVPGSDQGVVAARLSMTVLWQIMAQIRFGETGQAYIIDRQGEIVAHPDPEIVLARTNIADHPEVQRVLAARDNRWGGMYTNFANVSVVGSTVVVHGGEWIIFTEISQAEAFEATLQAFLLLGGGSVLAGVVIFFLTNRTLKRVIFEPVERLRAGADRIGLGDLEHRIEIDQQDEIGQVAAAFNEMAVRLRDREAALARARDAALAASRFKSRMLASVSHDLRTPLNAIIGYSDMLEEGVYGPLTDRQMSTMERILVNGKRLLSLINSILDEAQIEAGKLNLHYNEFAPTELVDEMQATMGLMAESKGLTLEAVVDPDLPEKVVGDVQRISQVVFNLVDNAVKFTQEGWVRLRIHRYDDIFWAIEVADTGPGIPQDAQAYIFDPFRQVDGYVGQHQGVGLGLSIVKQLVVLMGGEIRLVSVVGQGSTFVVHLPFEPPQDE